MKTGYRLINVEPRKAFTLNELSIWMENSKSGGKESQRFYNRMDVLVVWYMRVPGEFSYIFYEEILHAKKA